MEFWEFPFGVEVEAPDTAIEELERFARLSAGTNWGMEFDCTAMHFRFEREEDVKIPFCLLGYEATREAAMTGFAKSWRRL